MVVNTRPHKQTKILCVVFQKRPVESKAAGMGFIILYPGFPVYARASTGEAGGSARFHQSNGAMELPQCTLMNHGQGIHRYKSTMPSHTQNTIFGLACPTQEVWKNSEDLGRDPADRRDTVLFESVGTTRMSGPLWPDPNHNSKRATLYGSSVPYTRQSINQEDSLAISGLTTNGEIYNDKTYFIPLGGERSL